MKLHHYRTHIEWTGNTGEGTSGYTDYERSFTLSAYGKPDIAGSADPAFRGDASRWNPEEPVRRQWRDRAVVRRFGRSRDG